MRKTDLDGMTEDWDEDQAERSAGLQFFSVPQGRSYVRILPPHEDANGRAIVKGGVHWVNGRSVSCPVAFRESEHCWLCERTQELYDTGEDADRKEATALAARARFHANVILPSESDTTPLVWEFGRSVYDQIMRYMADPDYGDITDPDDGYDLIVEREGSGLKTRYHIRARKSPSALSSAMVELLDEDPEAMQDLRNLRPFLNLEEMQELYEGESGDGGDYDDDLPPEEDEPLPGSGGQAEDDDDEEREDTPPPTDEPEKKPKRKPEKKPARPRRTTGAEKRRERQQRPSEGEKKRPGRPIGGKSSAGSTASAVADAMGRRERRQQR